MKFPGSIKVCITIEGQEPYYATALKTAKTPAACIAQLNRMARARGLPTTYTAATDEQYIAYRTEKLAAAIARNA